MGICCCSNQIDETNENKKQKALDYDNFGSIEKEEMFLKEYKFYFNIIYTKFSLIIQNLKFFINF